MAMSNCLGHSMSMCSSVVPVPEANAGVLRMKNGQSAPMPDAICSSFSCVNPRLNISLRAFKVKAASEEPPPRPAPSGITLGRKMLTGGMLTASYTIALYDRITRYFS